MNSIYVQIASYRDPELVPTIKSLLKNAKYPHLLTICIAHQYDKNDAWDNLDEFKNDNRFIIIDIPYKESKGTCWARYQIQRFYDNQKYTLQLDSHHRFSKHWDETCVDTLRSLQMEGNRKPILTTYLPSYDPQDDPKKRVDTPWGMAFDKFTPKGMVFFRPYYIKKGVILPIPARFFSGHFAFTLGRFCKEVRYDPHLYFHGEEISMAVRAYTSGFSLFHPDKVIAWHEYSRDGRTKHWDDNTQWSSLDENAQNRVRDLLGMGEQGCTPCTKRTLLGYDVGNSLPIEAYQMYAGINFKDKTVQQSTLDNKPPEFRDEKYLSNIRHTIVLERKKLPNKGVKFVAVIYEDKNGDQINRQDYTPAQIASFIKDKHIEINSEFIGREPYKYIVWPHSQKNKWIDKIEEVIL